jgi:hypothetical protein
MRSNASETGSLFWIRNTGCNGSGRSADCVDFSLSVIFPFKIVKSSYLILYHTVKPTTLVAFCASEIHILVSQTL